MTRIFSAEMVMKREIMKRLALTSLECLRTSKRAMATYKNMEKKNIVLRIIHYFSLGFS